MTIRKPLRNHLAAAWEAVAEDYARQRINSERSLQASLWSQLNERLPTQFRMIIEPRFTLDDGSFVIPDIVICNSRFIICIIEIKYRPRAKAAHIKDVRTLNNLATNGHPLSLSNQRFSGPAIDGTIYTFANKPLFVWAGFHRAPNGSSYDKLPSIASDYPKLRGRFLQMHAETHPSEPLKVFSRLY